MTAAAPTTGMLEGHDFLELFYRWHPAEDARAALVVIHGFVEHSGRYEHVFAALEEAGYATLGLDLRGHGRSQGRRAFVRTFDEYSEDIAVAVARAHELLPDRPVFLLGHSMGGLCAVNYSLHRGRQVDGLVLSCPFLGVGMKVPGWKAALGKVMSSVWPSLAIPSGLDPKLVSRDPDVVKAYIADPLVTTKATARWYTEMVSCQARVMARASMLAMPTLVMQAGQDSLVDKAATLRFYEQLGAQDRELKLYEPCYHEIFNEPEKMDVLGDLVAWLDAHTS